MTDSDNLISGFDTDSDDTGRRVGVIDYDSAQRLDRSGSTCDAYLATLHRRRVFVKRLKEQYRNSSLHRAAFDKEFDIGVGLDHPSLPRYIEFDGDAIVMDYIEGDTLADLLARHDDRLGNRAFVRHILAGLVDVVGYLHNRHIVHCDIKADNVIVSPYTDRPPTLIDLDKAYTSWLDSTSGNPALYGCEDCADGRVDFRGIAWIAKTLGQDDVYRACMADDVTADSVRRVLSKGRRRWPWIWGGVVTAVCLVAVGIAWTTMKRHKDVKTDIVVTDVVEKISKDTVVSVPESTSVQNLEQISDGYIEKLISETTLGLDAKRSALWSMMRTDTLSKRTWFDAVNDYIAATTTAQSDIIRRAVEQYKDMDEIKVQTAVRNHPAWKRHEDADRLLLDSIAKFNERF